LILKSNFYIPSCKSIIDNHGGTISVEGLLNLGSTYTVAF